MGVESKGCCSVCKFCDVTTQETVYEAQDGSIRDKFQYLLQRKCGAGNTSSVSAKCLNGRFTHRPASIVQPAVQ